MKRKNKFNLNTRVKEALRKVWLRSPMRYEAIKEAKVEPGQYRCWICQEIFKARELQVDHLDEPGEFYGKDWHKYIEVMFYGRMKATCKACHKQLTAERRQARLSEGEPGKSQGGIASR